MSVHLTTLKANELLTAIKEAISDGRVAEWTFDSDGDFTYSTESWMNRAWLRPRVMTDRLILHILTPKGQKLGTETYAVYHARFIEMVLAHFDTLFTSATASALPESGDVVAPH